jgi:hypothetical protein
VGCEEGEGGVSFAWWVSIYLVVLEEDGRMDYCVPWLGGCHWFCNGYESAVEAQMVERVLCIVIAKRYCDGIDREITCKLRDAGLEKVNVIRCQLGRHAWNIHVSRHLPSTTSGFLFPFIDIHISPSHIDLNVSSRTAIRAAITHSRHPQLRSRHCRRPLPQLFIWPEPNRSAWP